MTTPIIRHFEVDICDDCVNLRGQECHTPGCRFFLCSIDEVSDYLDRLLIRPRIEGKHTPEVMCEIVDCYTPLKAIFKQIDDGVLVRNISRDAESNWAIRMMTLVRDIAAAKAALDKVEGK